ncbi:MAG: hypothetical protein R6X02_33485 [Enhygromyxa sp.]
MVADTPDTSEPRRPSKLRWVLGWIVTPGLLIAALFLAGVHLGARRPDRGLARLLLKVFDAKPGVALVESEPQTLEPRPGAKPGEPFSVSDVLTPKQLQAAADKSFGLSAAEIDCAHVCRAYTRAEYDADVYAIEFCQLGRVGSWAPSMLLCRGQLEADAAPRDPSSSPSNPSNTSKDADSDPNK